MTSNPKENQTPSAVGLMKKTEIGTFANIIGSLVFAGSVGITAIGIVDNLLGIPREMQLFYNLIMGCNVCGALPIGLMIIYGSKLYIAEAKKMATQIDEKLNKVQ